MEIRLTTRIALALLIAVILGLTFYAYPSLSGFTTLVFRAAAIVGGIAIAVLFMAGITRRRPGRFDFLLVLAAIGLVIASWPQLTAVGDFNALKAEIEAAGEENVAEVIAATETKAGILVRSAETLRDTANQGLDELLEGLWPDDVVAIIDGPEAGNEAALAGAVDRLAEIRQLIEDKRAVADDIVDNEIEAIQAIDTPLPDSARLSFVAAAADRAEADRGIYQGRLDLADERLTLAEAVVAFLAANAGGYSFNAETGRVQFDDRELGIEYEAMLVDIEHTIEAEDEIVAHYADGETAALMALVEAAGTTP